MNPSEVLSIFLFVQMVDFGLGQGRLSFSRFLSSFVSYLSSVVLFSSIFVIFFFLTFIPFLKP